MVAMALVDRVDQEVSPQVAIQVLVVDLELLELLDTKVDQVDLEAVVEQELREDLEQVDLLAVQHFLFHQMLVELL
jgi:hypothetical protein